MPPLPQRQTPLLVYDGDCHFCKFCVDYWKRITGSRVSYAPYQKVAIQYPEIPLEAFRTAAQLIDQQGTVWSGAAAIFRSLATVPEKRWLLWCYLHLPGFAFISGLIYRWVARHRRLLAELIGLHRDKH